VASEAHRGSGHAEKGVWRGPVKKIEAILSPFSLDEVMDALATAGIEIIAATNVKSFGLEKEHTEWYRGTKYTIAFLPAVRIEAFVPDEQWSHLVEIIQAAANRGAIRDGSVLVFGCEEFALVPTGHCARPAFD
jgi:nitrogen regulatory protein P-II 1